MDEVFLGLIELLAHDRNLVGPDIGCAKTTGLKHLSSQCHNDTHICIR